MSDATGPVRRVVDPTAVGRAFAALSGLFGLVFLAVPVTSGLSTRLDPPAVVTFVHALVVAYGLCLVGVGWLGREGHRPLATVAPALLAAVLLVLGPGLGYPLSPLNWAGLVLASVSFGGVAALWTLLET